MSERPRKAQNPGEEHSDGGAILLEDKADMTFLDDLMEVVRAGAKESKFNQHQLKLLADRCGAIHRTLAMMHHTTAAPNTLSAFRSAEYLVGQHIGAGWETFLVHRFTATELFEAARVKIRMVWSLQSTARWEAEDAAAVVKDSQANIILMRELDCITMPTLPTAAPMKNLATSDVVRLNLENDEEVLHFYQRRAISGWKLPWHQVDCIQDGEPLAGTVVSVEAAAAKDRSDNGLLHRKYFRRSVGHESKRFSFAGLPLTCLELPGSLQFSNFDDVITPKTLENFIVDMKCRYNWSHPNLVKCVGGFAEKFDATTTNPYLSLGAWHEDLENKAGYVSLHELLYTRGRKYHIATAIQMVLLIADALQYAIFSSVEVNPEIVASWSQISPTRIMVSTDAVATAAEVGRSKTVDRVPGMQGECHVRFLPSFYVENTEVSRWSSPVDAANAACYSLTQLLCCLLGNTIPFVECVTQDDIVGVRGGVDYCHTVVDVPVNVDGDGISQGATRKEQQLVAVPREEEPDSKNLIPKMIPQPLQTFLERGLAKKKNPAKMKRESDERRRKDAEGRGMFTNFMGKIFMAGISIDVAEDDGPQPFTSIQHFRRDLTNLARQPGIASLNTVSPHVSKAAANSPCPKSESVHLEDDRGEFDDFTGTNTGGVAASPAERNTEDDSIISPTLPRPQPVYEVGVPSYVTVHENEIHKGHDVTPSDFAQCYDYGYPSNLMRSRSEQLANFGRNGQPLNPPRISGRETSQESNKSLTSPMSDHEV